MEIAELIATLRGMNAGHAKEINTTAVIRALYPDIEDALKRGVGRIDIVETLQKQGVKISVSQLDTILYRLRKRIRENPQSGITPQVGAQTDTRVSAHLPVSSGQSPQTATLAGTTDEVLSTPLGPQSVFALRRHPKP